MSTSPGGSVGPVTPHAEHALAEHFARREQEFRPSPVRAVFELALDPQYVSLTGGDPDTTALPHDLLAQTAARLLRERGAEILQYGSGAGIGAVHDVVAGLMARQGARVDATQLLVTTGSQMGIDLASKLLVNPGDVIIAEGPTYVGAMGVFGAYEAELRQVPVDEDGLDPEAVAEAIYRARAEGRRVAYVYTIPHHQNPSGTTLTLERRRRLVEVCAKLDVLIIEDDPYALVHFPGGAPLPSLFSMNPEGVIHLGSFSKIFAPGLRVGWLAAAPAVRDRLQIAGESVDIHPTVLAQELVAAYVGTPTWARTLEQIRGRYAERCARTMALLEEHMPPGVTWTRPRGGFFTWLTLEGVDPRLDLLDLAISHRVIVVPGSACFVGTAPRAAVRLAYSKAGEEDLREGIRRLAGVIEAARELSR